MITCSQRPERGIHRGYVMKRYVRSLAFVLLLVSVRTPYLSADGIPTNDTPALILDMFRQAGALPDSHEGRVAFLKERFLAMGSEGIDFLIRELKKPNSKPGPHGGEMRVPTFASTAIEIYAGLGDEAYDRLSRELQRDSSPVFWRNAICVHAFSDRAESIDVLAGWVSENGADATSKSRISARAYEFLRVKLRRLDLPVPPFAERQDDLPVKMREWWQSNRQKVLQQYLRKSWGQPLE